MNKQVEDYYKYIMYDVLRDIRGITSKKMFGGYTLYLRGNVFAFVTADCQLYFKVNDELKIKFQKYDSHPFVFSGYKDKDPVEMVYWTLPEEIMEDKEVITEWVEASAAVSQSLKRK